LLLIDLKKMGHRRESLSRRFSGVIKLVVKV